MFGLVKNPRVGFSGTQHITSVRRNKLWFFYATHKAKQCTQRSTFLVLFYNSIIRKFYGLWK